MISRKLSMARHQAPEPGSRALQPLVRTPPRPRLRTTNVGRSASAGTRYPLGGSRSRVCTPSAAAIFASSPIVGEVCSVSSRDSCARLTPAASARWFPLQFRRPASARIRIAMCRCIVSFGTTRSYGGFGTSSIRINMFLFRTNRVASTSARHIRLGDHPDVAELAASARRDTRSYFDAYNKRVVQHSCCTMRPFMVTTWVANVRIVPAMTIALVIGASPGAREAGTCRPVTTGAPVASVPSAPCPRNEGVALAGRSVPRQGMRTWRS